MKKNIYVITIAALLILIPIFFIFEKNKSHNVSTTTPANIIATTTPATTRSTSTSVALGWETYVNEKFGFSIDYPKNFVYIESNPEIYPEFAVYFGDKKTIVPGQGIVGVSVSEMYKTFDQYFKDVQDPHKIDKKGEIDGNEAFFYSFTSSDQYNFDTRVVIKYNNKFWTISTESFNKGFRKVPDGFAPGAMDNFLSESDYDRVISSFKFLK
ncbi:MAG: hypothetical protein PHO56_00435 [Patescibacteria group bacterium]|nr:hypothetical protein [Patescibacteria group bacterium]